MSGGRGSPPTTWAELLRDGLSASGVHSFIAAQLASREAAIRSAAALPDGGARSHEHRSDGRLSLSRAVAARADADLDARCFTDQRTERNRDGGATNDSRGSWLQSTSLLPASGLRSQEDCFADRPTSNHIVPALAETDLGARCSADQFKQNNWDGSAANVSREAAIRSVVALPARACGSGSQERCSDGRLSCSHTVTTGSEADCGAHCFVAQRAQRNGHGGQTSEREASSLHPDASSQLSEVRILKRNSLEEANESSRSPSPAYNRCRSPPTPVGSPLSGRRTQLHSGTKQAKERTSVTGTRTPQSLSRASCSPALMRKSSTQHRTSEIKSPPMLRARSSVHASERQGSPSANERRSSRNSSPTMPRRSMSSVTDISSARATTLAKVPSRLELELEVRRLKGQLEWEGEQRSAAAATRERELEGSRRLEAQLAEAKQDAAQAKAQVREAATREAAAHEAAARRLEVAVADGRKAVERARAAEERAAQVEAELVHAGASVDAMRNTCELLVVAREEALEECERRRIEVAVMAVVVGDLDAVGASKRQLQETVRSQATEASRLDRVLTRSLVEHERERLGERYGAERALAHLRAHVRELETLLEEQQAQHARTIAERELEEKKCIGQLEAQARSNIRGQRDSNSDAAKNQTTPNCIYLVHGAHPDQVAELSSTRTSLESERSELMTELSATLQLVERLQASVEEASSERVLLRRTVDELEVEITRLNAEQVLSLHELQSAERGLLALHSAVGQLADAERGMSVARENDRAAVSSELLAVVDGLNFCLESFSVKLYEALSGWEHGVEVAKAARELNADIQWELRGVYTEFSTAIASCRPIESLRRNLIEASTAQVQLAVDSLVHAIGCADDAYAIDALRARQLAAAHAAATEVQVGSHRVDIKTLAAELQAVDMLAARAMMDAKACRWCTGMMAKEVASCEYEMDNVALLLLKADSQCLKLKKMLDEAREVERELRHEGCTLREELRDACAELEQLGPARRQQDDAAAQVRVKFGELQDRSEVLQTRAAKAEVALAAERVATTVLGISLEHTDNERASAISAASAAVAQLEETCANLAASQLEVSVASDGAVAAAAREEALRSEARRWEARATAAEAWRVAVGQKAELREAELAAQLRSRDATARSAIVDSVMRRQECLLLASEIKMEEAAVSGMRTKLVQLMAEVDWWKEQSRQSEGERSREEGVRLSAQELHLKQQLATLSQQLLSHGSPGAPSTCGRCIGIDGFPSLHIPPITEVPQPLPVMSAPAQGWCDESMMTDRKGSDGKREFRSVCASQLESGGHCFSRPASAQLHHSLPLQLPTHASSLMGKAASQHVASLSRHSSGNTATTAFCSAQQRGSCIGDTSAPTQMARALDTSTSGCAALSVDSVPDGHPLTRIWHLSHEPQHRTQTHDARIEFADGQPDLEARAPYFRASASTFIARPSMGSAVLPSPSTHPTSPGLPRSSFLASQWLHTSSADDSQPVTPHQRPRPP